MKLEPNEIVERYQNDLNKYFMINVIARRSRALVDGDKPMVDPQGAIRPNEIATRELLAGKLRTSPKTTRNKLVDIVREVTDRS
ncbi:DNA-directed RNA polymerase subunit omega [Candidatus Sumerlaeota bacterium]|nr:DNA-directed RNA polymerase subunit omega [Candidatus Sumerlaeota bacterium]